MNMRSNIERLQKKMQKLDRENVQYSEEEMDMLIPYLEAKLQGQELPELPKSLKAKREVEISSIQHKRKEEKISQLSDADLLQSINQLENVLQLDHK